MKKNNQGKYNSNRAKLLLKGIIPSFIGIFLQKDKNRIIFNSTANVFFDFNSRHLFEYFIEYYPNMEVRYVINDEIKRKELNRKYGKENNYFIETKSLRGMLYALRAKAWIVSAFETPVGGLFLKFNRFVYLLGHGTHFKAIVFNENNLSLLKKVYYHVIKWNFSYYLVTSKALLDIYQKAYKCNKEQLVVMGEPRSDKMFIPDIKLIKQEFGDDVVGDKNILYAPTWRKTGGVRLFPFDDMDWGAFVEFLEAEKINIFLRLHPSFQDDLSFYTKKTSRIKILDNAIAEDVSDVIGIFDLLVTDYSSIHISFLLLDKPVLFLPYDFDEFDGAMGFIAPYDELTPGPKPNTMVEFTKETIELLHKPEYYKDKRDKVSAFFNDHKRDNCKMNAEFILQHL